MSSTLFAQNRIREVQVLSWAHAPLMEQNYLKGVNMMTLDLEVSKSGKKCLWECGGGMTNSGRCQIVAGKNGEKKRPIFIRRKGELANSVHALIPIEVGDIVVNCYRRDNEYEINVYRVTEIIDNEAKAKLEKVTDVSMFQEAIEAAKKKSRIYHCREALFIE